MAKYNESEGYISIEFSDRIMPYISQVQETTRGFVLYNLKEITNFGSIYATRLYELLQEYKQTGWVQRSIEQLRCVTTQKSGHERQLELPILEQKKSPVN
jgi:plasmid replication initiation protein